MYPSAHLSSCKTLNNISIVAITRGMLSAAAMTFCFHTMSCRPLKCPDDLYELMSECLEYDGNERPNFNDIITYLSKSNQNSDDLSDTPSIAL